MEQLTIQLPTPLAMAVAVSRGWTPTVDDETQEMIEDNYPQIPNPVTYQQYLEQYIPNFIQEYVLIEGRKMVNTNFESTKLAIMDQVNNGAFDELILSGNIEGITEAVKASL